MGFEALLAAVIQAVTKELLAVAMKPDVGEVGKANEGTIWKKGTTDEEDAW